MWLSGFTPGAEGHFEIISTLGANLGDNFVAELQSRILLIALQAIF